MFGFIGDIFKRVTSAGMSLLGGIANTVDRTLRSLLGMKKESSHPVIKRLTEIAEEKMKQRHAKSKAVTTRLASKPAVKEDEHVPELKPIPRPKPTLQSKPTATSTPLPTSIRAESTEGREEKGIPWGLIIAGILGIEIGIILLWKRR